jgi:hypothetical protein
VNIAKLLPRAMAVAPLDHCIISVIVISALVSGHIHFTTDPAVDSMVDALRTYDIRRCSTQMLHIYYTLSLRYSNAGKTIFQ